MARLLVAAALSGMALPSGAVAPGPGIELAVGAPDQAHAMRIRGSEHAEIPLPTTTPLGSVWKLFVYAYLEDEGIATPDYRCTGRDAQEESYCCTPGASVDRDHALAQSCGLYFEPARLGIKAATWQAYWKDKADGAPEWLTNLSAMQAHTEVSVASLLAALDSLNDHARRQTMRALARTATEPRARPLLTHAGTTLRIKTWSLRNREGQRTGGFAGWLADGTPVWLRGPGTSATVIAAAAPWLPAQLPSAGAPPDEACVSVRFFNRYPLRRVNVDGEAAADGPLRGKVDVEFVNGQKLAFSANGDMRLLNATGKPQLEGRYGMNDYVARVIQREAAAQPQEAARALGVAARTYLARHASYQGGCYRIADDTATQRVSPAPASRAARAAADWSDGLIMTAASGRYHSNQSKPGQLSWERAVLLARAGQRWDEIVTDAYGATPFGLLGDSDAGECSALPRAEHWLAQRDKDWRNKLQAMPGFEAPQPLPRICRLDDGNPYADLGRNRIYATGVATANERMTVTHEYLHFALANHPRGRDEEFVERTARELLGVR